MKKYFFTKIKVGFTVAFATVNTFVFAQSYNITPNDTLVVNTPFGRLNHYIIQQNNLTNGALVFSWKQLAINIPATWAANLCDNGHCYDGFPLSGTMDTIFASNYGFMSVAVNPDTTKGTAFIQYAVWEINNPTQIDTLTWIISSTKSTGLIDINNTEAISIFPNPANNNITINTSFEKGFKYIISNANGKEITEGNSTINTHHLAIENLEKGIYILTIINNNNKKFTRKIIITH